MNTFVLQSISCSCRGSVASGVLSNPAGMRCSSLTFLQGQKEGRSLAGFRAALQPPVRPCLPRVGGVAFCSAGSSCAAAEREPEHLRNCCKGKRGVEASSVGCEGGQGAAGSWYIFLLCQREAHGWRWWMLCALGMHFCHCGCHDEEFPPTPHTHLRHMHPFYSCISHYWHP